MFIGVYLYFDLSLMSCVYLYIYVDGSVLVDMPLFYKEHHSCFFISLVVVTFLKTPSGLPACDLKEACSLTGSISVGSFECAMSWLVLVVHVPVCVDVNAEIGSWLDRDSFVFSLSATLSLPSVSSEPSERDSDSDPTLGRVIPV